MALSGLASSIVLFAAVLGATVSVQGQHPDRGEEEAQLEYKVAMVALGQGDLKSAAEHMKKAAALAPENAVIHYNLAVVQSKGANPFDPEEAMASLTRALELGLPDREKVAAVDLKASIAYALEKTAPERAIRRANIAEAKKEIAERHRQEDAGRARLAQLVDQGDGTVLDSEHVLVWTRSDNKQPVNYPNASRYCDGLKIGKLKDWKLPTIDQFVKLFSPLPKDGHHRDAYLSTMDLSQRFELYKGSARRGHYEELSQKAYWSSTKDTESDLGNVTFDIRDATKGYGTRPSMWLQRFK